MKVIVLLLITAVMIFSGISACTPGIARPREASQEKRVDPQSNSLRYSNTGFDITPLPRERVAKLAARLSPEAYRITQKAGTEAPFCGNLLDNKKTGVYCCAVCGLPIFSSEQKFISGTGWPSFWREFDPEHVSRRSDNSHGMDRTEISCARCNAHLGHVFPDGPPPTGERHCVNSASLTFYDKGRELPIESRPASTNAR